ncbi:MAG TPA: proline dehydrogenase family protein [Solirubrobacteraceae bacterium]|jgi:RHH-type proline utilization regulon transcriptional repressor/proline dehydrogenase/delta 1-pyrroline-5-carboxylate dehydrogenase|nr:proline dehydrogenase family protein [Solirubrobacteraceae bacterium]
MKEGALEANAQQWGELLAENLPHASGNPAALLERRTVQAVIGDPRLRAALFRFVDVRPACADSAELVRHLHEYLGDAAGSHTTRRLSALVGRRALQRPTAAVAAGGVAVMARKFIAGSDAGAARDELASLWRAGCCATLDLLGEATLTNAEGDAYAARCAETLRILSETMSETSSGWPVQPLLEDDGIGRLPRANLSVKVSALTPHLRANAPQRTIDGARERLLTLLRLARELDAHLHIDMESLDTREGITELVLELLAEPEFTDGPSAGIVLQAYLTDSEDELDRLLGWLDMNPRTPPFTIRLVKGAYWDHEVVSAVQHGWPAPVFTDRRSCDRHYEHLTRRLLDARADGMPVRPAIASHNLRSLAHALAYSDQLDLPPSALELQVLRGLGDDTAAAIAAVGRRVRVYCPVGDLVAGMAYLVRRLLENTSNDSFLAAQSTGAKLDLLLEKP